MRRTDDLDELEDSRNDSGAGSGGQSGDLQGLDSGEVTELLEEGQSFEAAIVSGIEDAPPAGKRGIRTREVPEDDVPLEYLDDEQGNRN